MDVQNILEMKGNMALTIAPEATIEEASSMLRENYIGAIVVANDAGTVAGILSERDIAVALPQYGGALGETLVSEIMTVDVVFCTPEMSVKQVLDIMVTNGIRHLPVLDGDKLSGVISLRDVVGNWLGGITDGGDNATSEEPAFEPFENAQGTAA
ncbi:MAG: CBS domain-containing protein [Alphaproteobacteria bacterium]